MTGLEMVLVVKGQVKVMHLVEGSVVCIQVVRGYLEVGQVVVGPVVQVVLSVVAVFVVGVEMAVIDSLF